MGAQSRCRPRRGTRASGRPRPIHPPFSALLAHRPVRGCALPYRLLACTWESRVQARLALAIGLAQGTASDGTFALRSPSPPAEAALVPTCARALGQRLRAPLATWPLPRSSRAWNLQAAVRRDDPSPSALIRPTPSRRTSTHTCSRTIAGVSVWRRPVTAHCESSRTRSGLAGLSYRALRC